MIAISAHESARPHWSDRHPDFTADELRQNKQLWDEIRDFRRKPEARMPEEEKAFADAANVVRDSLHDQLGQAGHPEIADLDRAYHLWSKAHEIFGSSDMQRVYGGAAAPNLIKGLMSSAAWKTATVKARALALKALKDKGWKEATRILLGAGIGGTTASVAANVLKPAPVTPDAPFDVSIATNRTVSCWRNVRSMFSACTSVPSFGPHRSVPPQFCAATVPPLTKLGG